MNSDLGSYYNALARDLLRSPMDNPNREDALKQGRSLKFRSIEVLQRAVQLKPGDPDIRVKLARVSFQLISPSLKNFRFTLATNKFKRAKKVFIKH